MQTAKMRQWRLITEPDFRDGQNNMALDSAILEAVSSGLQPPTLRLYGWRPMCLSLGYGQRIRDVDMARLDDKGWHLVRRPTGGKAILHGDELTYSLSLPIDHALAGGGVVGSYRRISRGLLQALQVLGLTAQSEHQGAALADEIRGAVCFELSSHYEITVNQRKLIGSAQLRRKLGILQHGTIPLCGDIGRICEVLNFDSPQARQVQRRKLRLHAVTLAEVMAAAPAWDEVAVAVASGFRQAFDVEMMPAKLSGGELRRRDGLLEERFGNPDWINKR